MNANQRRIRPILGHNSILSSSSLPSLLTIYNHTQSIGICFFFQVIKSWHYCGTTLACASLMMTVQYWYAPVKSIQSAEGGALKSTASSATASSASASSAGWGWWWWIRAIKGRYWDLVEESAAAVDCHSAKYKTGTSTIIINRERFKKSKISRNHSFGWVGSVKKDNNLFYITFFVTM